MNTPTLSICPPSMVRTCIELPASKSISNRALVLYALSRGDEMPKNLSDCDDTRVMLKALCDRPEVMDIGAAGTAMRFLTAYLSVTPGNHVLTGSERMLHRPIGVLVDALRQLGAHVDYMGEEGFPPLRIEGCDHLQGGTLEVEASISSQYLSALLMIGPMLEHGLLLTLKGRIVSRPYLEMTLSMMQTFGARVAWESDRQIRVFPGGYRPTPYTVENDWSAASYWYEVVALTADAGARVELPGLPLRSLQGDVRVKDLFEVLGVYTMPYVAPDGRQGVVIGKQGGATCMLNCNMSACPDLAQTVAVTCAMLEVPFCLSGLENLHIKETDRIEAMRCELSKFGYQLSTDCSDKLEWGGFMRPMYPDIFPEDFVDAPDKEDAVVTVATYDDHRMAMSFAPACCTLGEVRIAHPEVVSKSYPGFWDDLRKAGFQIQR